MADLIERSKAIDGLDGHRVERRHLNDWQIGWNEALDWVQESYLKDLPSAESEIIRCKDCKYRDENWRRVSVKWLPCMDVRTGSNWYCGSAERGEQDE